jgi:hypothetical protein
MSTSMNDELVKLVKTELLPIYIKYHQQLGIEPPSSVVNNPSIHTSTRSPQIPALLKPIKNSP